MRHELKAKRDVQETSGDRVFDNKKGETLEISAAGAEVALSLDNAYEHVREIPETPEETARIEKREAAEKAEHDAKINKRVETLMKENRDDLLKKAADLGIEGVSELKKEPLAKAIAEHQLGGNK